MSLRPGNVKVRAGVPAPSGLNTLRIGLVAKGLGLLKKLAITSKSPRLTFQTEPAYGGEMRRSAFLAVVLAVGLLSGCTPESPQHTRAQAHLAELRRVGLLAGTRGSVELAQVRRIVPVATRWSEAGEPFWWAELTGPEGAAGYLAWREGGDQELIDFALEGLVALDRPHARALGGVPPIQQFPIRGADGAPVASGCVPTAGASLIAYWSNRGTFDWQADDSHEGLVRRVRDRLPMSVVADKEGYADGKMALAGCFPGALAVGLREDADQYRIPVRVTLVPFARETLARELADGHPVLLSCAVLVPRKPQLTWGHEVVAVGQAEVAGRHYVGVIDNYLATRVPGTVRWIGEERGSSLLLVRPVK